MRRRVAIAAGLVAVALTSGCTGGAAPVASESAGPTVTASVPPTSVEDVCASIRPDVEVLRTLPDGFTGGDDTDALAAYSRVYEVDSDDPMLRSALKGVVQAAMEYFGRGLAGPDQNGDERPSGDERDEALRSSTRALDAVCD